MRPTLSLFTVPKPFEGHTGIIQENAIASWTRLRPVCEVILVGDERGTAEAARKFGARHVGDVHVNSQGTPLLNSVFREAERAATGDWICYVNADIILVNDFIEKVREATSRFENCVIVGRRIDLPLPEPLGFEPGWEARLEAMVKRVRADHRGMDYFVYRRGAYDGMPPFAIGRLFFDNWLVWKPRKDRRPVVDLTPSFLAIHSEHGYAHHKNPGRQKFSSPEVEENMRLLGGARRMYSIEDATHRLTPSGIVENRRTVGRMVRRWKVALLFYHGRRLVVESRRHPALVPVVAVARFVYRLPGRLRARPRGGR